MIKMRVRIYFLSWLFLLVEGKAGRCVKIDKDCSVKDFGFKTAVTVSKKFGVFRRETGADVPTNNSAGFGDASS